MARPRLFIEDEVIETAAHHFAKAGYNATSIDDLVLISGLKRGSLYKAFGSKLNLFTMCFDRYAVEENWTKSDLGIDLVIVCLREVVDQDRVLQRKCRSSLAKVSNTQAANLMGTRLIRKVEEK